QEPLGVFREKLEAKCNLVSLVAIEAVQGGQQEEQPLDPLQGSRAAQWGWGTTQHKPKQQTHRQIPTTQGAPPSLRAN
ncbi:hypothetical protein, partial [Enterobacter cloacae complex sp. 2DZ2F20B]|uniref:hypothetical protein n=1 Tax=Enterobacter cloacae complex sp. 2DZ2F20B TaxID=2511993 RepID=UPI001CA58AD5